jgi:hypothetical protein
MGIAVPMRGLGRETKNNSGQEKKTHAPILSSPEKRGNCQYVSEFSRAQSMAAKFRQKNTAVRRTRNAILG